MNDATMRAEMRRQVRLSAGTSGLGTVDATRSGPVGSNATSGTYAWQAAGISNITSTGEPFYSAPGGPE